MKKYTIKNVDCENCARKISEHLKKKTNANDVTINIISNKLIIDDEKVSVEELTKLANEVETGVEITDGYPNDDANEQESNNQLIELVAGFVFLVLGFMTKIELLYLIGYFVSGYKVIQLAFKNMLHKQFFDEYFLMSIATIAAIFINQWAEALAVMLFYSVGEYVQEKTLSKTKSSITKLAEFNVKAANLIVDDKTVEVAVEQLNVGDKIKVTSGERVPVDCKLLVGEGYIDNSHITGESKPQKIKSGDNVYGGSINMGNELFFQVESKVNDSTIAKLIELITYADSKKTKTEKFITRFSKVYTPIVVILSLTIVIFFPILFNIPVEDAIYRAVTLLVISCPCAFVLSVPLGYVVAIGHLAKKHILVKGSIAIDKLKSVNVLAFDKTGTITTGNFAVVQYENYSQYDDLYIYGLVKAAENGIVHPIAKSLEKFVETGCDVQVKNVTVEAGSGLSFEVDKKKFKIAKGDGTEQKTVSNLFEGEKMIASFTMEDEIKQSSFQLVKRLKALNVKMLMLTGDNEQVAKSVASKIKLNEENVHSRLVPENKLNIIENEINNKNVVAFVGDGINDAAAIKRSDVGISMGSRGSEITIESSDVVISDDNIEKVVDAIQIAQKANNIIKQNIIFAFAIKILFITLGIFGITTMWEAVFSDVGVTLIAIINSMRIKRG